MDPTKRFEARRTLVRTVARLRPVLKFGSDVVEKMPRPGDTWSVLTAKGLALADAAFKAKMGTGDPYQELVHQYELRPCESRAFVQVFFGTSLRNRFELRRTQVAQNEDLIEATRPGTAQRLCFKEVRYGGRAELDSTFHVTAEESFGALREFLWADYPHGLYLSIRPEPGSWRPAPITVHAEPAPRTAHLSARARENLERLVGVHRGYQRDGVPRCYLCLGPPGTGKSTFASLFGAATGGRTLKVDAAGLAHLAVSEFEFLLAAAAPNVLVVDDLDRAPMEDIGARLLYLMERLKHAAPHTAIVLTVNDITKLDHALLRSDRIDVPLEFAPPTPEELAQMVVGMCHHYGVDPELAPRVVEAVQGAGMGHAYVNDLCRRLRREPFESVVESTLLLHALSIRARGEEKDSDDEDDVGVPRSGKRANKPVDTVSK